VQAAVILLSNQKGPAGMIGPQAPVAIGIRIFPQRTGTDVRHSFPSMICPLSGLRVKHQDAGDGSIGIGLQQKGSDQAHNSSQV